MPEQLFVNEQNPGEAISAVKALQKANAQGQRIYRITQANQSTILPNIHHHPDTMDEIRNALNAGKEVITHADAVSVPGWSGAGYIITDPMTGDGAYKISGGGNGGWLQGVWAVALQIGSLLTSLARDNPIAATVIGLVLSSLAVAGVGGIIVVALAALASITNLAVTLETSGFACSTVIGATVFALTAYGSFFEHMEAFLIANALNAYGGFGDCSI